MSTCCRSPPTLELATDSHQAIALFSCLVHGCRDTQHLPFPAHACGAIAEGKAATHLRFVEALIVFSDAAAAACRRYMISTYLFGCLTGQ